MDKKYQYKWIAAMMANLQAIYYIHIPQEYGIHQVFPLEIVR